MKRKIRVLFLQSVTQNRSIEGVHSTLLRFFDREHVEVHVACNTSAKDEDASIYKMFEAIPDLHIHPTNFGRPVLYGSKFDIARNVLSTGLAMSGSMIGLIGYIKRHHIDIIHTADRRDVLCGIVLARLTGIKCIVYLHQACGTWMNPISLWATKQADAIIGVSQFAAHSAITIGACQPGKAYHALNAIEISQWNYNTDGSSIRREFGIGSDIPMLAIVSRVVPQKGHELLLNALSYVKKYIPDFKLLIVGGDDAGFFSGENRSYIEFLKEKADEAGLSKQVIFAGQRSDIQQILAACDFYTMPAFEEGCGLSFLEAMSMKKAVVALRSGGACEVVEHGKAGLLSEPGDVQQLAENILTLMNNSALRSQMGEYARIRIEQSFNPQRMADDVERIYRAVLGKAIGSSLQPAINVETILQQ